MNNFIAFKDIDNNITIINLDDVVSIKKAMQLSYASGISSIITFRNGSKITIFKSINDIMYDIYIFGFGIGENSFDSPLSKEDYFKTFIDEPIK